MNDTEYLSINQHDDVKRKSENDGWTDEDEDIADCINFIKSNIDYDYLRKRKTYPIDQSTLDLIVDIILEAYNPSNAKIKIQGQLLNRNIVKNQFEKLDYSHIEYVLDCIAQEAKHKKIKNIRMYFYERDKGRLIRFDDNYIPSEQLVEDILATKYLHIALRKALNDLSQEDYQLINECFFSQEFIFK